MRAFDAECARQARGLDAGQYVFDADAGARQLNALSTGACDDGWGLFSTFRRAARLGMSCEGAECVEGYCSTQPTTCGACTPYRTVGETCEGSTRCRTELRCSARDGGPSVCEPLTIDGEACGRWSDCASGVCVDYGPFDGGLRRCGSVPVNHPCTASSNCEPTAYCEGGPVGQCAPLLVAGDACEAPAYDERDPCLAPAVCLGGRCVPRPVDGPPGTPCFWETHCASGSFCANPGDGGARRAEGVCQPRLDAGEPCLFERRSSGFVTKGCQLGLECARDGFVCRPVLREGDPCSTHDVCSSFLQCEVRDGGGRCVPQPTECAPCGLGASCNGGTCERGKDGGGRCVPPAAVGAACGSDPGCQSRRCEARDGGGVCEACF